MTDRPPKSVAAKGSCPTGPSWIGPSFQADHQKFQELFWKLQRAVAGHEPTLRFRLLSGPLRRSVRHAHEGCLSLGSCGHLRQFDEATLFGGLMRSRHGTNRDLCLAEIAERVG